MGKCVIVWSHKASIKLFEILDFYEKRNGSKTYSKKLYKKLSKESNQLIMHPEIGAKTDFESVRGLIVDEYILFYEIIQDKIIIHTVWDSRQNPENLKIL